MNSLIKSKWKKKNDDEPVFRQIANFIEEIIMSGELPSGYVLPGHRKLAEMFEVGVNTVLHALQVLQNSDLVILSPRAAPVTNRPSQNKPDWDRHIKSGLYNPVESNFFMFADASRGRLDMTTGMHKDYYFRKLFNNAMSRIYIPEYVAKDSMGNFALREEILRHSAIKAKKENVMIVTSIYHALNLLFIGMLGHGTNLILPKPCNLTISNLVRTTGTNVLTVPSDDEGIMISALKKAINQSPTSILCISPNLNIPTCGITSLKRRKEILALCVKYRVPILEYDLFTEGFGMVNLPSLKSMDDSGIVIFINQIGIAGYNNPWLGWMIGDEYLLKRLLSIRFNLDAHQNFLTQCAVLEVMSTGEYSRYLAQMVEMRKQRAITVNSLLNKHLSGMAEWNKENLDYSVWLKFTKGINTFAMYNDSQDIAFHPGKIYDKNDQEHIFIYPAALSMEELDMGLTSLAKLAKANWHPYWAEEDQQ